MFRAIHDAVHGFDGWQFWELLLLAPAALPLFRLKGAGSFSFSRRITLRTPSKGDVHLALISIRVPGRRRLNGIRG